MSAHSNGTDLFDQLEINQESEIKKFKSLERYRNEMYQFYSWVVSDVGQGQYIPQRYRESASGRLYSFGYANLQNAPKVIRHCLLAGQYDYDIENCHFTLFSQLAEKYGFITEGINEYILKKHEIRKSLADALGMTDIDLIKKSLVSIIYGSKETVYYKAAIPKYLGSQRAKLFYSMPIVKAIIKDVRIGSKIILDNQHSNQRGNIKNVLGKNIDANLEPRYLIAHLLQGLEAKMLLIARRLFAVKITLLQHDGFTCIGPIDRQLLEETIKKETGYTVEYSEEKLKAPIELD